MNTPFSFPCQMRLAFESLPLIGIFVISFTSKVKKKNSSNSLVFHHRFPLSISSLTLASSSSNFLGEIICCRGKQPCILPPSNLIPISYSPMAPFFYHPLCLHNALPRIRSPKFFLPPKKTHSENIGL